MQSKATTVELYLAELPEERRAPMAAVRQVILKSLGKGYEEGMQYGMIGYFVPHSIYPAGYHCAPQQPLPFVCLASQKQHMSLYLWCIYSDPAEWTKLEAACRRLGGKPDLGKGCVRFKRLEQLPLPAVAAAIKRLPVKKFIALYESAIKRPAARQSAQSRVKKASQKPVTQHDRKSKTKSAVAKQKTSRSTRAKLS